MMFLKIRQRNMGWQIVHECRSRFMAVCIDHTYKLLGVGHKGSSIPSYLVIHSLIYFFRNYLLRACPEPTTVLRAQGVAE